MGIKQSLQSSFAATKNLIIRSTSDTGTDLSGANNIFGSIATNKILPVSTGQGFIPIDGSGGTLDLTGINHSPNWLGLNTSNMQWWAYNFCSPLAAVIDRLAEADTNGKIQVLDEDGVPKKKSTINKIPALSRVVKLLKNPNPLQTWEEFNSEQIVLCKIFGYCPVFCIKAFPSLDNTFTTYMFNLNPFIVKPTMNTQFSLYDSSSSSQIKEWFFTYLGTSYTIDSKNILLVKDGFVDNTTPNFGLPISKIAGLDFFISNICAAVEADNVLLKKKGPLGIFSYDQKPDMAGATPMGNDIKKDLQDELGRYGMTLGQLQYIISKVPLKWNSMSFNVQELMTKETVRQGIDGICDRFGYPAELMSGKNATYENRSSAEKFLYQNNIIPFSLRRMARYNKFFGLEDYSLHLDYSYLPVLQEDIMKAGQAYNYRSTGLSLNWTNGIISLNQYLVGIDQEPVDNGDTIYYYDLVKAHPELSQQKQITDAPKNT